MNTTHTPAPWKLDTEYSPANVSATVNGEEIGLAKVYLTNPKTRRREPQYAANARLIAAAPDLLALVELLNANAAESAEWIRARIAPVLAKVEGK